MLNFNSFRLPNELEDLVLDLLENGIAFSVTFDPVKKDGKEGLRTKVTYSCPCKMCNGRNKTIVFLNGKLQGILDNN